MATRKTKSAAPRRKAAPFKKAAAAKKTAARVKKATAPAKKTAVRKKADPRNHALEPLDLSGFPPESVSTSEKRICLACVLDIFTRHLGLSPRAAHLEVQRYTPSLDELQAPTLSRPWFAIDGDNVCPYCGSAAKWHPTLRVHRIEGGKAADRPRRELLKNLPQTGTPFAVLEEKATRQHAFYEWLEKISSGLDLDDPSWLREVSLHYLSRKLPGPDWVEQFRGIHSIRRSRRLEEGWEVDTGRIFLAPMLFDELLLVQYLVSRSHRAGGLTLEGRYTLAELFQRLRNSGYLRSVGATAGNPADALEHLVDYLGGGEAAVKFYHIVDRRDFLEKVKSLREVKPPKPKAPK